MDVYAMENSRRCSTRGRSKAKRSCTLAGEPLTASQLLKAVNAFTGVWANGLNLCAFQPCRIITS